MKYTLFIGRWQPFHKGHQYIVDSYVKNNKSVCIAIRDTNITKKDPIPAEVRKKIIENIYKDNEMVKVMIIPDIETVAVGRDVGYSIMQVPDEIKNISGTKVREEKTITYGEGKCYWFTGLSGSGKSTLAKAIIHNNKNKLICHIDGDELRKEYTKHLGYSIEDRRENIRLASELCKLLVDMGFIVIATFISPTKEIREMAKKIITPLKFREIFIDCSLEICEKRDVKGMYKKARAGEIKDFTGIDSIYEKPDNPFLTIDTTRRLEDCVLKFEDIL